MMKKTNFKNKTKCVWFFTRIYETKHNTDRSLLYRDLKKISISILFEKVFLGWKLSPIINEQGNWNENVLGRKKLKNLLAGCDVY